MRLLKDLVKRLRKSDPREDPREDPWKDQFHGKLTMFLALTVVVFIFFLIFSLAQWRENRKGGAGENHPMFKDRSDLLCGTVCENDHKMDYKGEVKLRGEDLLECICRGRGKKITIYVPYTVDGVAAGEW